jgi:hypothetical protein
MNKTKYKMMFFQGDTGGGGGDGAPSGAGESLGGAVFTPPAVGTTGDRPLPPDKLDGKIAGQDPQVPAQGEPKPAEFDPNKFTQEFSKSVADALKGTAKPAEPPMTKEEAAKILNVWEPDDAWYMQYDNLETRKAAIASMRDGLVKQADTIAQLRMQEALTALREEYAPKMSLIEEHSNAQREERFHGTFPQLKNPGLQPLISAVTDDLIKQGKTFTSESEMFKAVADGVAAVIKVTNPEFSLETAGSSPASGGDGRNNSIPVTTPGSGGGTGRSTPTPKGSSKRGLAVFE